MDTVSILILLATIIGSTIMSLLGLYAVRKRVDVTALVSYHEVAGYLLSVIGTLYAVLLGFIVVDALSKFDRARVLVEEEANGVANVFFLADNFPPQERHKIHICCLRYIDAVVDEEWATMRAGKPSPKAIEEMRNLWTVVSKFEPKTQNNQSLWESMLAGMQDIATNRRLRIIMSAYGIAPIMVTVLVLGAVITILFTYFFGLKEFKVQAIMTALVSLTLSLNICLVLLYGHPFRHGAQVEPTAFLFDKKLITSELKRRGDPLE